MNLRIAISCAGGSLRAWESACVDALERAGVEIVEISSHPGGPIPVDELGTNAPSQRVVAPAPRLARAGAIAAADDRPLDAIVHFGSGHPVTSNAPAPRFGVWTFEFGENGEAAIAPRPVAFDESLRGDPVVRAALVRDGSSILKSGWFETTPHSYAETIDTLCFGAAAWPARVAFEIAAGLALSNAPVPRERATASHASANAAPRNEVMDRLRLRAALLGRGLALRLHYLFRHEHWNVGVVRRPISTFIAGGVARDVEWLPRPKTGRFAADPFGIARDGTIAVLCEEFDYQDRRGYLSAAQVRETADAPRWHPVMRMPVHLSYPFLVERGGEVYCIPESSEAGEIAIHEAVDFPYSWQRRATLIEDFGGADSSVFEHDGRWWLLCTRKDAPNRCLYAWHADDLFGPWTAHARNPVKTDPRSSRPAGTPFASGGALYRPAQDCAGGYGRRVAMMRVTVLTPTDFEEEIAACIEPDPSGPCPDGLHTVSAAGDATLVDGKSFRFVPREFFRTLARYARAAVGFADFAPKGNSGG